MDNVNKVGEILGSGTTVESKVLDPKSIEAISELKKQTLKSIEWFLDLEDPNYNSIFHCGDMDQYDLDFHVSQEREKIIFDNGIEIPLLKSDRERLKIPTLSEIGDKLSVEEVSHFYKRNHSYTQVVYGDYEANDLVLLEIKKRGVEAFKGNITASLISCTPEDLVFSLVDQMSEKELIAISKDSFYRPANLSAYIAIRMKEFNGVIDNEYFIDFLTVNSRFISSSDLLSIFEKRRLWHHAELSVDKYEKFFNSLIFEDRQDVLLQIWKESIEKERHTNIFVGLIPKLMVARNINSIPVIYDFASKNGIELSSFI